LVAGKDQIIRLGYVTYKVCVRRIKLLCLA